MTHLAINTRVLETTGVKLFETSPGYELLSSTSSVDFLAGWEKRRTHFAKATQGIVLPDQQ